MAFENLMAQISLLVTQMENQPEDKHELYLQLRERLNEIRSTGMPLPEDLVRLEEELEAEFAGRAASQ
jgi:predicted  nucleic acid-binding Zn-ribbon protein